MDLKISKRHADAGRRAHSKCCPTALALRDIGIKNVEVGVEKIRVYKCDVDPAAFMTDEALLVRRVDMPKRLTDAIRRFDGGGEFKHGVYRIPGLNKPKGGSR